MTEVQITNNVVNGDAVNLGSWKATAGKLERIEDKDPYFKLTATENEQNIQFTSDDAFTAFTTHKLYVRFRALQHCGEPRTVYLQLGDYKAAMLKLPVQDVQYFVYSITQPNKLPTGSYTPILGMSDAATDEYACFDKLVIVDLTACFGAGNEPSAAWCNANIPEYFNGTATLPFWQYSTVDFVSGSITPDKTKVGSKVNILATVKLVSKLIEIQPMYSNEIYSGEV